MKLIPCLFAFFQISTLFSLPQKSFQACKSELDIKTEIYGEANRIYNDLIKEKARQKGCDYLVVSRSDFNKLFAFHFSSQETCNYFLIKNYDSLFSKVTFPGHFGCKFCNYEKGCQSCQKQVVLNFTGWKFFLTGLQHLLFPVFNQSVNSERDSEESSSSNTDF